MQKETNQHYKKHERIDIQKHGCEHSDSHFPELKEMKQGLVCAAGRFDMSGAMNSAAPIGVSGGLELVAVNRKIHSAVP
jgi:hypothetical protein